MNIRIFPDQLTATVYASAIVEHVVKTKSIPVLGLATGTTPILLYKQLIQFHEWGQKFSHVTTINLDEYVGLPPDHPQSYYSFMYRELFDYMDIPKDQIFIPNGDAKDLQSECRYYDSVIQAHPIDIQILGIGLNGHIGFNEPDTALKANTHVVTLSNETIGANARFFGDAAKVPIQAITMGLQPILLAKEVLLLAFGKEKSEAVKNALEGDVRTSLPASILQVHPNVTFILDYAAAELLDSSQFHVQAPA